MRLNCDIDDMYYDLVIYVMLDLTIFRSYSASCTRRRFTGVDDSHVAGFVPVVASTSPTSSICRSRRETPRSPPARRQHQSWRLHAIVSDRFVDELAASSHATPRLLETVSGMTHLVGETT